MGTLYMGTRQAKQFCLPLCFFFDSHAAVWPLESIYMSVVCIKGTVEAGITRFACTFTKSTAPTMRG